jgi:hypothetical protein
VFNGIKITPSKMPLLPLGQRAIPFYLNSDIHKVLGCLTICGFTGKKNIYLIWQQDFYGEMDSVKNPSGVQH